MMRPLQKYSLEGLAKAKQSGEWKVLQRIIDRIRPMFSATLQDGFSSVKDSINLHDLTDLIQRRKFDEIQNIVPFDGVIDRAEMQGLYSGALLQSAEATKEFFRRAIAHLIPNVKENAYSVTPNQPRIRNYLHTQTATLASGLTTDMQESVRRAITDSFANGIPPRDTAKVIRATIGLTPGQTDAVANFQGNLINGNFGRLTAFQRTSMNQTIGSRVWDPTNFQNLNESRIDTLVHGYASNQLDYRAKVIAQSELQQAVNFGQTESWNAAADAGLFNKDKTQKKWVVTKDEKLCPICAPLDQVVVDFDDLFPVQGGFGPVVSPPAHVQCRCAKVLVFEEQRGLK